MRICFLNPPIEYYSPISGGAVATILMQSARQLIAQGHDVIVMSPDKGDPKYDVGTVIKVESPDRLEVHPLFRKFAVLKFYALGWDYAYYHYYLKSFKAELKKLSPPPDIVIVFNDLVSPRYIKQAVPTAKTVVWLQNEATTRIKNQQTWASSIDHYLTCSQYIKQNTMERFGIAENKISVVHSGVDLDAFYPAEDFPEPHNPVRALFIGRIDHNKGPDIATDAVMQLRNEGVPIELTLAGGIWYYLHGDEHLSTYLADLEAKCKSMGKPALGHVPRTEVPALVRQHDIAFVLSRSNEPFGLVTLEAMASGCAVLASNRGGLPESCDTGAIMLDPDDMQSVVDTLRRLALNRDELIEWKRRAVERASRGSWRAAGAVLGKALEKVHAS
jgi:glycosyltransferase involved in cell wall biosynthesis